MTIAPYQPPERTWLALQSPALELANQIAGTEFVPAGLRGNPAAITAAILYGDEVGLGPMQALAKIAVINGRPTLAAEAQRALILHAGHDLWIEESNVTRCTVAGRRRDSEATSRITWTMDDARRANLANKQPWRLYPRQMLLARASAELARAVFPDAIGGLMATEELEDEPELAVSANGTDATEEKPKTTTRRRRRASVTAGAAEPAPESPAPASSGVSLPAGEQAVVDELERLAGATPEPDPEPLATDAQKRNIFRLMRELGLATDDRDLRLAYTVKVIGRELESSNELTIGEASTLIDRLEQHKREGTAPSDLLDQSGDADGPKEAAEQPPDDDIPF